MPDGRPIPAPGHGAVDFEERVNFDRLRDYRLARTREALRGMAAALLPPASAPAQRQPANPAPLGVDYDFQSPRPYPFGLEEFGWGVADTDAAMRIAASDGASTLVGAFNDPIGRTASASSPAARPPSSGTKPRCRPTHSHR